MKKTLRVIIAAAICLFYAFPCTAKPSLDYNDKSTKSIFPNSSPSMLPTSTANWFVAIGVGQQSPTFNSSMNVNNGSGFPAPFDQDIYTTEKNRGTVFSAALGRRWQRSAEWFPAYSLGLLYQHFLEVNVGNNVIQYSDPEFTNYSYKWDVSSDVLLASVKLNIVQLGKFSPYVMGGLGGAFNYSSNYTEYPLAGVNAVRVSPGFASNTNTQFAYNVGAGIEFQLAQQVLLSAEYQHQNLGTVKSGNGSGTWSNDSLNLGTLRSNSLLLNVIYLIGN